MVCTLRITVLCVLSTEILEPAQSRAENRNQAFRWMRFAGYAEYIRGSTM